VAAPPPPPAPAAPPPLTPDLTINVKLGELTCSASSEAIELPGGVRIHVNYTDGEVEVMFDEPGGLKPVKGKVISGADWIFVREDAVAIFDARITLAKSARDNYLNVDAPANYRFVKERDPDPDDFVIVAIIGGMVRLQKAVVAPGNTFGKSNWAGYSDTIEVVLPIRFEASGPTANWASPRFRALGANYPKYARLLQNQYVARGTFTVALGAVTAVALKAFRA
jgi:hypothetical protein